MYDTSDCISSHLAAPHPPTHTHTFKMVDKMAVDAVPVVDHDKEADKVGAAQAQLSPERGKHALIPTTTTTTATTATSLT